MSQMGTPGGNPTMGAGPGGMAPRPMPGGGGKGGMPLAGQGPQPGGAPMQPPMSIGGLPVPGGQANVRIPQMQSMPQQIPGMAPQGGFAQGAPRPMGASK